VLPCPRWIEGTKDPCHGRCLPSRDRVEAYFKELNNWGRWGHDDQLGTVNLITPAKQAQAQRLIKKGRTVSLARDVIRGRCTCTTHLPSSASGWTWCSTASTWSTRLDHPRRRALPRGLGRALQRRPFGSLSTEGATWCPIDPIFERGITTRGVFLDIAAGRKEGYVTAGRPVTPKELDEAERRAGVAVEPGDVVVVRSGDEKFRLENPDWKPRISEHPGLHLSCLEWFRAKDIAGISWDMMDERPSRYPGFGMSAHLAIPFLGLALIDNSDPERLAKACAEEGRNEFLFTATPLRLVGATGAPAHPLAIF
jgi:kynurenine formamidase